MTQYVTVKLNNDEAYIILKTTQYDNTEKAMEAIVEHKRKFLYDLFGGKSLVEDHNQLEQVEISAIWDD